MGILLNQDYQVSIHFKGEKQYCDSSCVSYIAKITQIPSHQQLGCIFSDAAF